MERTFKLKRWSELKLKGERYGRRQANCSRPSWTSTPFLPSRSQRLLALPGGPASPTPSLSPRLRRAVQRKRPIPRPAPPLSFQLSSRPRVASVRARLVLLCHAWEGAVTGERRIEARGSLRESSRRLGDVRVGRVGGGECSQRGVDALRRGSGRMEKRWRACGANPTRLLLVACRR